MGIPAGGLPAALYPFMPTFCLYLMLDSPAPSPYLVLLSLEHSWDNTPPGPRSGTMGGKE